jgi:hypothetical protein
VFDGLRPDRVMFIGNSLLAKKLYLLCYRYDGHYDVMTNLSAATAKRYIRTTCETLYDFSHKCDKVCSICTATLPCNKDQSIVLHVTDGFSVRSVSRII